MSRPNSPQVNTACRNICQNEPQPVCSRLGRSSFGSVRPNIHDVPAPAPLDRGIASPHDPKSELKTPKSNRMAWNMIAARAFFADAEILFQCSQRTTQHRRYWRGVVRRRGCVDGSYALCWRLVQRHRRQFPPRARMEPGGDRRLEAGDLHHPRHVTDEEIRPP
jgi:hypothetical protein